jgi:hypothetical protein
VRRLLALLTLAGALLLPAAASAHGGDAQTALLTGDTSYPIGVPAELRKGLDGMVRAARGKGYALKVALVQDQYDVGQNRIWLFDPQAYADFLSGVLAPDQRILTVNPTGFGGNALGEAPAEAVTKLQDEQTTDLDELTRRAMRGVAALTKANGTPVPLPAVARASGSGSGGGGSGGGAPPWLIVAGPILLVGLGLLGVSKLRPEDQEA